MTEIVSESERQRRVERMRDVKGALQQGMNVEKRTAQRELKADRWCNWFRRRMDAGADPMSVLPDALAELETRIDDQTTAAIRELKADLVKTLK